MEGAAVPEPAVGEGVAPAVTRELAMAETTTDHATIRAWAEARDGKPARVKGTGDAEDVQPE